MHLNLSSKFDDYMSNTDKFDTLWNFDATVNIISNNDTFSSSFFEIFNVVQVLLNIEPNFLPSIMSRLWNGSKK